MNKHRQKSKLKTIHSFTTAKLLTHGFSSKNIYIRNRTRTEKRKRRRRKKKGRGRRKKSYTITIPSSRVRMQKMLKSSHNNLRRMLRRYPPLRQQLLHPSLLISSPRGWKRPLRTHYFPGDWSTKDIVIKRIYMKHR